MASYEERMRKGRNLGRNDPCPCGSESKFKRCCMKSREPGYIPGPAANRQSRRKATAIRKRSRKHAVKQK